MIRSLPAILALALLALPAFAQEEEGVSAPVFENTPAEESFYSQAVVHVHLLGRDELLEGFHVFVDSKLVGTTPVDLSALLVNRPHYTLSVQKEGYLEATRPRLPLPREGSIDITVLPENPTRYYTRPAWIAGLALMAGSLVAYAQPQGERAGFGMLVSGVGLTALVQGFAHLVHLPRLKKKVEAANRGHLQEPL